MSKHKSKRQPEQPSLFDTIDEAITKLQTREDQLKKIMEIARWYREQYRDLRDRHEDAALLRSKVRTLTARLERTEHDALYWQRQYDRLNNEVNRI